MKIEIDLTNEVTIQKSVEELILLFDSEVGIFNFFKAVKKQSINRIESLREHRTNTINQLAFCNDESLSFLDEINNK